MRAVFIGCVEFSKSMIEIVEREKDIEIVGIVTKSQSRFNTDFFSLQSIAARLKVSCFLYDEDSHLFEWMKKLEPDVIFCLGWSHLLGGEIIKIPKYGVVGHHPTMLPKCRGRHPVIWALVLGLKYTASSFFFIDSDVDSGDIISQSIISISFDDTAFTLYKKITDAAKLQIKDIIRCLVSNKVERKVQDQSVATYWRKRTKEDGCIDWRMSSYAIYNLVRALTHPYVGAHCVYKGKDIKIWKVRISYSGFSDVEPGKIIAVERNDIHVKCEDAVICLYDHEFNPIPEVGTYL